MNVKRILFEEQRGRCATCDDEREIERLVVDHDHGTGFIRGLLCRSCNVAEGTSRSPRFERHRANPPAGTRWKHAGSMPWNDVEKMQGMIETAVDDYIARRIAER